MILFQNIISALGLRDKTEDAAQLNKEMQKFSNIRKKLYDPDRPLENNISSNPTRYSQTGSFFSVPKVNKKLTIDEIIKSICRFLIKGEIINSQSYLEPIEEFQEHIDFKKMLENRDVHPAILEKITEKGYTFYAITSLVRMIDEEIKFVSSIEILRKTKQVANFCFRLVIVASLITLVAGGIFSRINCAIASAIVGLIALPLSFFVNTLFNRKEKEVLQKVEILKQQINDRRVKLFN